MHAHERHAYERHVMRCTPVGYMPAREARDSGMSIVYTSLSCILCQIYAYERRSHKRYAPARDACSREMHAQEIHARALFPLRCPSASGPSYGTRHEALITPAEEEGAEEEERRKKTRRKKMRRKKTRRKKMRRKKTRRKKTRRKKM
jgi:hypothetical protein